MSQRETQREPSATPKDAPKKPERSATPEPAKQTPADQQAEAGLLKSSGGDPLTQESD